MHDVFDSIRGLLKVNSLSVDNKIFQLHYKVTMFFLLACSLLVTQRQYFGDPIDCIVETVDQEVMDTYCWIHATFTIPEMNGAIVGHEVAHPGIANPNVPGEEKREIKHHKYYQWVTLVLALQGLMFYAPHWLWKTWEGGKLESIVMGLSIPVMNKEERHEKIHLLADYLHASLHHHNFYAIKFFLCELLNLANCLFNMWFMNEFLGGMFFTYGIDVLAFTETNQEERTDPMIVVFPRVTKCSFNMYGPSGTIETHDLMCVLALNIINEKIYVFMWFWFVILAIISTMALIYRLLVFCVPAIRSGLLQKRARLRYKNSIDAVSRRLQVGDFFLLYLLSKNVELLSFSSLMEELSLRLSNRRVHPDLDVSPPPVQPERFHLMNENA
ncbi:innexin 2 [Penaeus vannamei]|uniref:Innexin n=1 Tax=Penaeus vannamei TaxID=6689 RepID=A0A3R7SYY6_PENVA|nr:innexin 2 [Penaeus vannamei]